MRKIFLIIIIFCTFLSFSDEFDLSKEEKEFLNKNPEIVFIGQTNYPPFEFLDENGEYTGITIELIRWIAIDLGFRAKFYHATFKEAQDAVLTNNADVITSFFYSEERDKKFDFTIKLFDVPASIFIKSDRTDIKSFKELNNKVVAIQEGDYALEFLNKNQIKFENLPTKDFGEAVEAVVSNKADAVIGDEQIVMYSIYSNKYTDQIKKVGNPLYQGIDCMAVKKGNEIILSILNKGINRAKKNGVIDKLYRKWIGITFNEEENLFDSLGPYLLWFAIIVSGLFLLVYSHNNRLKRAVSTRTRELMTALNSLKESENRFRLMFDKHGAPMLLIDAESYDIIDANDAAVKFYGYTKEQFKHLNLEDLDIETDSLEKKKGRIKAVIDGETNYFQLKHKLSDNTIRDVENYAVSINYSDGQTAIFNIIHDITERKTARQDLYNEKERLAVTLRCIGDGVITTCIKGYVRILNKKAEELTGYTQKQAEGRHISEVFNIISAITNEPMENPLNRILETKDVVFLSDNVILISKDQTKRNIADSAAPIRDDKGVIIGMVLVFRDVTERKKMEEEIIKNKNLESIGVLAGGIAHDFNNLLTGILGNIMLAKSKVSPTLPAFYNLTEAEKASLKAKSLTSKILTFASGGSPVKSIGNISEIVKEGARSILRKYNNDIELKADNNLFDIEFDKEQIIQAVNNIILNASEAMSHSEKVHININNVNKDELSDIPLDGDTFIKISVTDKGSGIPQKNLPKIFDPYFSTKPTGTGLGLASSYSIIKKHGGHISVVSKEKVGTTFFIYLPTTEKSISSFEYTSKADKGNLGKVLIMDDDDIVRKVCSEMLEAIGYETVTALDGETAVELYKNHKNSEKPFDIVIFDLMVPGRMGGQEAMKRLIEFDPKIKGIVASGYSNDEVMANYRKYGFAKAVLKPFRMDELRNAVKFVLERCKPLDNTEE